MVRVEVRPELLHWACERAGLAPADLSSSFPQLEAWTSREMAPTLHQLERFARAVHVPIGYLFLDAPPVEPVPIPDFRTVGNRYVGQPSPNLLDTIYICQQRQDWFHDYAKSVGEPPLSFVGSARLTDDIESLAARIRVALDFDLERRHRAPTWTDALRQFIEQADVLGVLVMCSGVVLNNNRRRLDPEEFRGFALADDVAPLVFINGADTKAAQMFTLAHELAHVWLGQSALSDAQASHAPDHAVERWCNDVAAELLVPLGVLRSEYDRKAEPIREAERLARRFKVSALVTLRRMYDAGGLSRERFWQAFNAEAARLRAMPRGSGGNFYLTQAARVSRRFARALISNTLEGHTLHRDAFRMLGFSKLETFHELGRSLGVYV